MHYIAATVLGKVKFASADICVSKKRLRIFVFASHLPAELLSAAAIPKPPTDGGVFLKKAPLRRETFWTTPFHFKMSKLTTNAS
jgi:hypothetical protein